MKAPHIFAVFVLAALASCGAQDSGGPSSDTSTYAAQAARVTIYRDAWGVPHSYGKSDGDAAFGMAYAQAEDDFRQLEENFIWSIGRAAEAHGMEAFMADWVNHSFDVVGLSKRDYEQASPEVKALLDGYAAGLNYFLATHPEVTPRLLGHFEPWYSLAFIRQLYYMRGFLGRLRISDEERRAAYEWINDPDIQREASALTYERRLDELAQTSHGSNAWAANNGKTAGDETLLFINPHLPAFGPGQVYEAHMMSDAGWNFTGYSRFGFPLPYVGFNPNLGWASTDNFADQEDAWFMTFDHADDPLAYRFDGAYRTATVREGIIHVKTDDGMEAVQVRFMASHNGPIIGQRQHEDGSSSLLAARLATFEEPGWLDQWYGMSRAQDLGEFRAATSALKMQFGNYTYADRAGNIWQVQNGAIPRRDPSYDWNSPVDGSTSATEWQGYHSLEELPQVLNPVSEFIQNTNTTPFMTSDSDSDPKAEDYPAYMVRSGDNARSRNARRILQGRASFDYDTWRALSLDTRMQFWQEVGPEAVATLARNLTQDPRLADVHTLLADWDGTADAASVETTLFVEWREALFPAGPKPSDAEIMEALTVTLDRLQADWGDWRVPWGEINRSQRVRGAEIDAPEFCDACPSFPTIGVPGWTGGSQIAWTSRPEGLKKRYQLGGNSYTATVVFPADPNARVKAHSVHVFGASGDPASAHYMDQATLLAAKKYKPAWLYLEDVQAGAARAYHPGKE